MDRRLKKRRRAGERVTRTRMRAALLSGIALTVAGLLWILFSGQMAAWEPPWTREREAAGESAETILIAAPATPAPLSISVTETELITQTVALEAEAPPSVLIYHTHASEAYLLTADEPYAENGKWRTLDNERNVVAIGALLQETLWREYGIVALHDTGNYESPKLASAYSRSLTAMERYRAEVPTLALYIDLHRDAYGDNPENAPRDYRELGGKEVARIMLVVGTGEGATGGGFGEMPDFAENLALATRVTDSLRAADAELARDIRIKTGRYNQHVSNRCMLVEVGHTANTFTQAKNAIPYLAKAVAEELKSAPAPDALASMRVWTP